MKRTILVCVLVALVLLVGCKKRSSSGYYPLALDNTWTYVMTSATVMKGIYDTSYTTTDTSTSTVAEAVTVQGKSGWRVEATGDTTMSSYVVEESDKILGYSTLTDSSPTQILKLPLASGATWVMDSLAGSGKLTATVKGQEAVTVPAGTFSSTFKVEAAWDTGMTTPVYYWYSDGVGLSKFHFSVTTAFPQETSIVTMTQELMNYTIK